MRKLLVASVILLMTAGCAKEGENLPEQNAHHTFSITTTPPDLETGTIDTKGEIQTKVSLRWSDGDKISIINLTSGKNLLGDLTAKVQGETVKFEGELTGSVNKGDMLAAIFPSRNFTSISAVSDFDVDFSSQNCLQISDVPFCAYSVFECATPGTVVVTAPFEIPVSVNQISVSNIKPSNNVEYVELSGVGSRITFHINKEQSKLELSPAIGKVRISNQQQKSRNDGTLFAYCALAESPASIRSITVKSLPDIYSAGWAKSAMKASKFYTSSAADFDVCEYKDLMISPVSPLEVGFLGDTVAFNVTSNKIDWTASSTPALEVTPSSGGSCENLQVTVTVPRNDGPSSVTYIMSFKGKGCEDRNFVIKQGANPEKELIEFPDSKFKQYMVLMFDEDGDGEISMVEAENITNVNCSGKSISDVTGLEKCPNLRLLNCSNNYVSDIILPNLPRLETVMAFGCPIEHLDFNNDAALKALYLQAERTNALYGTTVTIDGYDQASTLHLAFAGTPYTELKLINSMVLTSFDVTENIQLKKFSAYGNTLVTAADVSTLAALTDLDLHSCALSSLNVDNNVSLVNFDCSGNSLSTLNIDNNVLLKDFNCSGNKLQTVKLLNCTLLEKLNISQNALLNVSLRNNTLLRSLDISSNLTMTALALKKNTALETLDVSATGIADIDLSENAALKSLKITGCPDLYHFDPLNLTQLEELIIPKEVQLYVREGVSPSIYAEGQFVWADGVSGVVFDEDSALVVIAKKIVSVDETTAEWGWYGTYVGEPTPFNGMEMTNLILSGSPAAQWCRAKGPKWYLSTVGEVWDFGSSDNHVCDSTLNKIGGTPFQEDLSYWTCSQKYLSSTLADRTYRYGSSYRIIETPKNEKWPVRAVRLLF